MPHPGKEALGTTSFYRPTIQICLDIPLSLLPLTTYGSPPTASLQRNVLRKRQESTEGQH